MPTLPDAVFIVDIRKEKIALAEAKKLGIKVIAIVDTNCDPENVDFPIPGNDDARRSIDLYCSLIKETILNAKKVTPEQTEKKAELADKKKKIDKSKTVKEIDREKLDAKFAKKV